MALNIISNYAANVAHRNLMTSDMQATESLAKLSAGTRVLSAKDDAAALAVGSRLAIEVSALRQASVNASQASSMLQIADGAMSQVFNILSRMKSLSVQSASGQLSSTDRSNLNTEFTQLTSEIDRIASNTTFSGTQLVAGSESLQTSPQIGTSAGASTISIFNNIDLGSGNTSSTAYSLGYNTSTHTFTLSNGTTSYSGTIPSSDITSNKTNKAVTVRLTASGQIGEMDISLGTGFQTNSSLSGASGSAVTLQSSNTSSFSFKVGSGTTASDDVSISVGSVTLQALGLTGDTVDTVANANQSAEDIDNAVNQLNTDRANIGALQNRLEFASSNISIATENTEAARSNLMDLDVAAEYSNFTSKQILLQAGVAMLAQANQMPQNLLRLFQ